MDSHNIQHRPNELQVETTVGEAARAFGVCEETIRRRIRQGKLDAHKPSGIRQWLVRLPQGGVDAE
jgi:excisionase family DNA binding protein